MHCSLEDTICHVKLAGCFAKGRKLRVQADKISVASNIITCEHIELECNLSMVVESNLECPSISLKSDSDVRLSSSARLKTETLKIIGQTVFIDGHVEYQRHFPNNDEDNLKENCTILNVHINGNLHIGRDGFIRILDAQKLKNEQGTLQLHVEGDICNHGTIEAPNRIEVKNRSLLSCRKCDKDTASRYFSSIKHTHGIDENDDMPPSDMKL
ncbi:unnamed protein product [Mytilus edulis]|uniref:Uncharacterized protein n=1 Tax=Mytilus edulis TaxID=6550 RepID=A0A8S3PU51_MYTED|nr:unnamed protein product [Mytilus edulis]